MGMMFLLNAIPFVSLALVAWAVATRRLSIGLRLATLAAAMLAACGVWTLLRTDGVIGAGSQFAWRWTKTHEEQLLARVGTEPLTPPPAPAKSEMKEPPPRPAEAFRCPSTVQSEYLTGW